MKYEHSVSPLTKKNYGTQKTVVQLMEINKTAHSILTRSTPVLTTYSGESFDSLHRTVSPESGNHNIYCETLSQIGARFLSEAMNGRNFSTKEKKEALLKLIANTINDSGGVTPIDIDLIGALIDEDMRNGFERDTFEEYIANTRVFSNLIAQILENIISLPA